jgi:hypothetical protein
MEVFSFVFTNQHISQMLSEWWVDEREQSGQSAELYCHAASDS